MDLSMLKQGATYYAGQVYIADPVPGRPVGYQSCRIRLKKGWCYIELNERDGEGTVDVYPAGQIAGIVNLYGPTSGSPKAGEARMAGEFLIPESPALGD